jgi:hypothetical protein
MKKWQYWLALIALFSPLAIVAAFFIAFNSISCENADWLTFWGQFLTNNWPSWKDGHVQRDGAGYALGIGFRAALAYAPLAAMIGIFWKLGRREKERRMTFSNALRNRDRAIEREILNLIPESIRAASIGPLRAAIREAAEGWERDYLPKMLGTESSNIIERLLNTPV